MTVLYAFLLAVLVAPERLTPRSVVASLRADWLPLAGLAVIAGAYFLHEMIRSSAPAQGRTLKAFFDLLEAVARGALPNVAGLALPSHLWVTVALAVVGAALLSALGRRGLSALVFFAVVLVANVAVTWFGRSDVGLAAATEARYLTALTLGFWIAVAIALAPAQRGPWRRLPRPQVQTRDGARRDRPRPRVGRRGQALPRAPRGRLPRLRLHAPDECRGEGPRLPPQPRPRPARPLGRPARARQRRGAVPALLRQPPDQPDRLSRRTRSTTTCAAEGRGPRLFALTPDAEVKPVVFSAAGPATTRSCDGRCELVLTPRDPKAASPCFVRLRLGSGTRVTATTFTLARALMKQGGTGRRRSARQAALALGHRAGDRSTANALTRR